MREKDRIWILMARKLAGEASEKELRELQDLLMKHPQLGYSTQIVDDLFKSESEAEAKDAEAAFERMLARRKNAETRQEAAGPKKFPAQNRTRTGISVEGLGPAKLAGGKWPVAGMYINACKTAWRNLQRNKGFSSINIFGLAIGMAGALLIFLWVGFEFSMDEFNVKKDRIYQLYTRAVINDRIECWNGTPMVMGPVLQREYPQVEEVTRLNWVGAFIFSVGDQHLATKGFIADPGFLNIFSYPLLRGNPETALKTEHSVVLTEEMARKLFGEADPMGQLVKVDSNALFTVTGILKNLPHNSSFKFDYLIPWSYMKEVKWTNPQWEASTIRTYVLMKDSITEEAGNLALRNIISAHEPSLKREVFLHPLHKWNLYSSWRNGKPNGGGIDFVRIFATIGCLILLIACINYMNLSTARSRGRAREVGIRKTIGARKGSLVLQFMGESVAISFMSGLLALVIIQPGLYVFNSVFETHLAVPWTEPVFWVCMAVFILLTGIVAGSYPAFYLSSFRPMYVLKGIFKGAHNALTPRKVLVVMQFTVAIILMISTIVIYRQIDYGQSRDVGYRREGLAYTYIKGDIPRNYEKIKKALLNTGLVASVARTNSPITDIWFWDDSYQWKGKAADAKYYFATYLADRDLVGTMGLTLVSGRDVDMYKYPSDSTAVVLNETAAHLLGWQNPIGKELHNRDGIYHVVGLVKDFIPMSPYMAIPPVVCRGSLDKLGTLSFRLNEKGLGHHDTAFIREVFRQYNPNGPFEYYQAPGAYFAKFTDEQDLATLTTLFAGLAIFISCLGLFGLAASTAESRIKEIGVRKVLGASVSAITTLLSRDFLKWVMIAFVIASPVAWWTMNSWLQGFQYHVNIAWWVFIAAGVLSLLVAGLTVSFQSVRAAMGSPVKALRSE